jgi:Arrestin (or S-antigen), N-terminal domain
MSVRIQFDKPNACHTNLDFVTGRVILILQSDTTLQAITVKLEGESKTRLAGVRSSNAERNDKQKIEIETHKVRKWCELGISIHHRVGADLLQQLLYKVLTVFPDPEIQQASTSSSGYTLLAGQYEYPFRFKVCVSTPLAHTSATAKVLRRSSWDEEAADRTCSSHSTTLAARTSPEI